MEIGAQRTVGPLRDKLPRYSLCRHVRDFRRCFVSVDAPTVANLGDSTVTADSLTIYAIQRSVDGQRISDFDQVIDPNRLDCVDDTRDFQSPPNHDPAWSARMYFWKGDSKRPPWVRFIEEGLGGQPIDVSDSAQDCAVVVVKAYFRVDRLYAIPFGLRGRFQIRRDLVDQRYGLRVALNLLYEGDTTTDELDAAPRVHQVESKTVAANTMRTIRHANRRTDFEDFALNPDTDQLAGITGQPRDSNLARRVRGTDSLRIGRRTSFDQLGDLCRNIARAHERSDYRRRFQFVDQRQGISDPSKIVNLTDQLCQSLSVDPNAWAFTIPGVLDFDQVSSVRISTTSGKVTDLVDPTTNDVINLVGLENLVGQLPALDVEIIDGDGNVINRWSMFECLDGQIDDKDHTFLLESGTFYQIEPDYLAQLNQDVDAIRYSSVKLPPSWRELDSKGRLREIDEGAYNEHASTPTNHLLLDKRNVIVPGRTSPVEVCDILTLNKQLVHVKRKFLSNALSHLFAQGHVSTRLLKASEAFRARVREKIGNDSPDFQDLFAEDDIVAADWEVVYAIIGPWNNEPPSVKLPFFSKVNLRDFKYRLRLMGFEVTLAPISVTDA